MNDKNITKHTVVAVLSRGKARHVIHGYGFPRSTRGRQQSIEALLLDGWFGNGAGSAGLNVLPDVLSKVRPIKILLQYCHSSLNLEIPTDPIVVRFPNHLGMLA